MTVKTADHPTWKTSEQDGDASERRFVPRLVVRATEIPHKVAHIAKDGTAERAMGLDDEGSPAWLDISREH